jgi:hypothetical protein
MVVAVSSTLPPESITETVRTISSTHAKSVDANDAAA